VNKRPSKCRKSDSGSDGATQADWSRTRPVSIRRWIAEHRGSGRRVAAVFQRRTLGKLERSGISEDGARKNVSTARLAKNFANAAPSRALPPSSAALATLLGGQSISAGTSRNVANVRERGHCRPGGAAAAGSPHHAMTKITGGNRAARHRRGCHRSYHAAQHNFEAAGDRRRMHQKRSAYAG